MMTGIIKYLKSLFTYKLPDYVPTSLTRKQIRSQIARRVCTWRGSQRRQGVFLETLIDEGYFTPPFDWSWLTDKEWDELRSERFTYVRKQGWTYTIHVSSDVASKDVDDNDVLIRFV